MTGPATASRANSSPSLEGELKAPEILKRPLPAPLTGLSHADILSIIQEALEDNRVDLYLQPVVALPQRKTRFYEAYSRIRTPEGQILMPDDYVEIAQAKGLMEVIDNLLLFRCVQLVRRVQARNLSYRFFVNVSPYTAGDAKFLFQFIEFMSANKKLASSLIFEFEQAAFERQSAEVRGQLGRLASLGFAFSIDQVQHLNIDFQELARCNVKFIKIPAQTLLSALRDGRRAIPPEDLKEQAARAEIDIICERIESEKTVVEVLDYDVDYGQGFLFGRPGPLRESA